MERVGRGGRRGARLAGALVLLAGLAVVVPDVSPVAADPAPTTTCTASSALDPGASGPDVACLQFLLGLGGYYGGELTSHYDQATRDAVAAYQAAHPPLVGDRAGRPGHAGRRWASSPPRADDRRRRRHLHRRRQPAGRSPRRRRRLHPAPPRRARACSAARSTGCSGRRRSLRCKAFQAKSPPLAVDGLAGPRTLAALGVWSGHTRRRVGRRRHAGRRTPTPTGATAAPDGSVAGAGPRLPQLEPDRRGHPVLRLVDAVLARRREHDRQPVRGQRRRRVHPAVGGVHRLTRGRLPVRRR